ncbi:MAG: hypothetical protein HY296_08335 [Thaumarchaeota archaeon]|nr:hypothetical protein [Nitrososphaerota archaeon]
MRADEQPGQYVLRLVEHYAAWDLAKFVFLLPGAVDMSRVGDKLTTIAIDQLQIAIYKGIENVLFQIYDELPEKGRIDDTKVRDILLRIIGGLVPEPLDDKPDTASYLSREVVRAGIAQRPTSEDDVGAEVCVGCGTTQDISGGGVALNGKSGPLCSGCMRASAMGTLAAVLGEFVQGKGSKGPKG